MHRERRGSREAPARAPASASRQASAPTSGVTRLLRCSRLRREFISGGEGFRGSDEAVVSDDPSGQQNPLASQGPLDGRVGVAGGRATMNRKILERVIPLGIADSWERELRWRIRRSHGADVDGTYDLGQRRRSPLTVHLKPYWGKPAVRNFRGGRGNP